MSSAMIGKLVLLHKNAQQNSIDLRLARISENVLEVLKITRLAKVFRVDDDDPDLLDSGAPNSKPSGTLDGESEPPSN
jgi:anti-anti-sigma regulatory factor